MIPSLFSFLVLLFSFFSFSLAHAEENSSSPAEQDNSTELAVHAERPYAPVLLLPKAWQPKSRHQEKDPTPLKEKNLVDEYNDQWIEDLVNQRTSVYQYYVPYDAMAVMPFNVAEYQHAGQNFLGVRDGLDKKGIEFGTTYTSDIAGNPVGGRQPNGFTYADNIAFSCLLETEKLFGWHGGYLMMSGLQVDGVNLSQQNIGNQFVVQQVYNGQVPKWYELSYDQRFFRDRLSWKVGRVGAGDDFDFSPMYWYGMNGGIDTAGHGVNSKVPGYPNATWGSRVLYHTSKDTVAKAGIYQMSQASVNGLNWCIYPQDGLALMAEMDWNPEFCKPRQPHFLKRDQEGAVDSSDDAGGQTAEQLDSPAAKGPLKGLPGHYFTGGYYASSSWQYTPFDSTENQPNAFGFYAHADQMVYRPNPANDAGLTLWTASSLCPQQNISLIPFHVSGGTLYNGLIPGRLADTTILAFTYGNFSTTYAASQEAKGDGYPTYELVYELGYRINMTKFAYFQPDLQWVVNPGGTGDIPNALVVGAQTGIVF